MDQDVGAYIKHIRKERGLTLQQVAAPTGLSASYISLLERGLTSSTVSNLHKICQALQVTMADLFANLEDDKKLVRNGARRVFYEIPDSIRYEAVIEGPRQITSFTMTVLDELIHESNPHVADECGFILEGSMAMTLDGVEYRLEKWDSIYVTAGTLHSYYRTSAEPCISLWTGLSVTYQDLQVNPPSQAPAK